MNPLVANQRRAYVRQCHQLGVAPCGNGGWFNHARTVARLAQSPAPKPRPVRKPRPSEADLLRAWWLERFTLAEIQAMAGALWGEL